MRSTLLATSFAALIGLTGFAGDAPSRACCAKAEQSTESGTLKCSLTGKEIEKCCCVEREGKLYCPLADQQIEKCCCTKTTDEQK